MDLQLQSRLECIHELCLRRSQDPCIRYCFVTVYPSSQPGNVIEIRDDGTLVTVNIGMFSLMNEDDWLLLVTGVLGPVDPIESPE